MKKLNNKGFSLLELVMVCVMIGILTSIGLPKYRRAVDRARVGEALSLMRSIYDSCERYAWEHPVEGNRSCWAAASAQNGATFENLDIIVKGQFVENSGKKKLQTKNFVYTLTGNSNSPITAEATKGVYSGAKIEFNGQEFSCDVSGAGAGEGQQACKVWGAATWNQ